MAENVRVTAASENPLCARLQKKFEGRGVASAGSKAARTVNNVKNSAVAKTANPFEETAQFVPAASYKKTAYGAKAQTRSATAYNTQRVSNVSNVSFEKTATFQRGQTFSAAYERAAGIRAKAADFKATTRTMPKAKAAPAKAAKKSTFESLKAAFFGETLEEKKVKSSPISLGLILSGIVIALIIVLMIFSIAQINEFKNEISQLEGDRAELLTRIEDLHVSIDAKNNIRVIEDEATNRIGMVKSNEVASKYVSISDGERIEVACDNVVDGEENYGVFGTLMSAMGANWDHLMEYIH